MGHLVRDDTGMCERWFDSVVLMVIGHRLEDIARGGEGGKVVPIVVAVQIWESWLIRVRILVGADLEPDTQLNSRLATRMLDSRAEHMSGKHPHWAYHDVFISYEADIGRSFALADFGDSNSGDNGEALSWTLLLKLADRELGPTKHALVVGPQHAIHAECVRPSVS